MSRRMLGYSFSRYFAVYMPAGPLPTIHTRAGGGEDEERGEVGGEVESAGEDDADIGTAEDGMGGCGMSVEKERRMRSWCL